MLDLGRGLYSGAPRKLLSPTRRNKPELEAHPTPKGGFVGTISPHGTCWLADTLTPSRRRFSTYRSGAMSDIDLEEIEIVSFETAERKPEEAEVEMVEVR